ncbi:MAG: N-acetylmuramic acid 6-phosphate etherase [Acidobacteriota bacterium]|nr:N-acetylmuramic acid 6-phosphate etherase [Acidobacteriota bacterium]MDH3530855.1 N-acetylmuramic acid 6-phosphate etherase [Acidobacteriota bacterium]
MIRITESENPFTSNIDQLETIEALRLINNEDKSVAAVVSGILDEIAAVTDKVFERLSTGGRLFYTGTGTSGRLGVLDASELPPTFGVSEDLVQGVIAGGYQALHSAVESSEDDPEAGAADLLKRGLSEKDAVIGIAASGTTLYTVGAVEYARSIGCFTACITCNPASPLEDVSEEAIVAVVGPEAVTGSTRMKSGTAQKMILNMISTVVMIKLGYVKGNRMVNVRASNIKLVERALGLLVLETGISMEEAESSLARAEGDLKTAIVMVRKSVDLETAKEALESSGNVIEKALVLISSD